MRLQLGEGVHLVAWTSPYIPFFARDELLMLKGIGHLLELVLERFALAERERHAQAALSYQAHHDDVTGLPNRLLFLDRLDQAVAASCDPGATPRRAQNPARARPARKPAPSATRPPTASSQ